MASKKKGKAAPAAASPAEAAEPAAEAAKLSAEDKAFREGVRRNSAWLRNEMDLARSGVPDAERPPIE